jgi:Na+/melibiose symporter-like transporter
VKSAAALGTLIAGVGLDLIGFPTAIAAKGGLAVHIAPATLRNLGLLYGPGTAAILALSAVVFLAFDLTRAKHTAIQEDLAARRR